MKKGFTLAEVLITLGVIGVVAAITTPILMKNYQRHVTVNRLKKAYTTLSQAMQFAQNEYGDLENWDYSLTCEEYMKEYISPYVKKIKSSSTTYYLTNGTEIYCSKVVMAGRPLYSLRVDINGKKSPNILGKDRFLFYIFNKASTVYITGLGNAAKNITKSGLYPDGYGFSRNVLKNDTWRGCNRRNDDTALGKDYDVGAYCTGLIIHDGWKISDDYNW